MRICKLLWLTKAGLVLRRLWPDENHGGVSVAAASDGRLLQLSQKQRNSRVDFWTA